MQLSGPNKNASRARPDRTPRAFAKAQNKRLANESRNELARCPGLRLHFYFILYFFPLFRREGPRSAIHASRNELPFLCGQEQTQATRRGARKKQNCSVIRIVRARAPSSYHAFGGTRKPSRLRVQEAATRRVWQQSGRRLSQQHARIVSASGRRRLFHPRGRKEQQSTSGASPQQQQ